jgi:hypothetical protein
VLNAGPFTFNANGTWTYQSGGGRWLQEAGVVVWNFTNASGLVYTANTQANSMTGIMGYLTPNGLQGSFYALRAAPPPTPSAIADESPDAATHSGADEQNTDPAIGPVN